MSLDRYEIGELIAVSWNPRMAELFPNAEHFSCRQSMYQETPGAGWLAFDPPRCMGYHCPKCGVATNSYGHHHGSGRECE